MNYKNNYALFYGSMISGLFAINGFYHGIRFGFLSYDFFGQLGFWISLFIITFMFTAEILQNSTHTDERRSKLKWITNKN